MSQSLSYTEVSAHNTKKDLFVVIHDKIYDASTFVDEHPGGEEVLLDVAGADSTEAFEDVGHSDEAREILEGLLVGTLKRGPNDPPAKSVSASSTSASSGGGAETGFGIMLYGAIVLAGVVAFGAYKYMQSQDGK